MNLTLNQFETLVYIERHQNDKCTQTIKTTNAPREDWQKSWIFLSVSSIKP